MPIACTLSERKVENTFSQLSAQKCLLDTDNENHVFMKLGLSSSSETEFTGQK